MLPRLRRTLLMLLLEAKELTMPDETTHVIINPEPGSDHWCAIPTNNIHRLGKHLDPPQTIFRMEVGMRVIIFVNGTIYAMQLDSIDGNTVVFKSLASSRLE